MAETADRIETLFAGASMLPPEERGAYLERECSGDPALLDRLVALLRAHNRDRPARQQQPGPNGGVFPDERRARYHHRRPLQVARGDWPGRHGDGQGPKPGAGAVVPSIIEAGRLQPVS